MTVQGNGKIGKRKFFISLTRTVGKFAKIRVCCSRKKLYKNHLEEGLLGTGQEKSSKKFGFQVFLQ